MTLATTIAVATVAVAATAQARGPATSVVGSYQYVVFEGGAERHVAVEAHDDGDIRGTWSFRPRPGAVLAGPITCLNVQGDEAFMFGPGRIGGRGAFLWVRDGDAPGGAEDSAITWIQDLPTDPLPPEIPPQTLEEMEGWCLNAGEGFPGFPDLGPVPLTAGNLTIFD